MKHLNNSIVIYAPREIVWRAITEDIPYRKWTDVFFAGSYFEGGWGKGEQIRFLAKDDQGKLSGMIAESKYPEYISIKHIGQIINDVEDYDSAAVKAWVPVFENYRIDQAGEHSTRFMMEMDITDKDYNALNTIWPKALIKLKEVCEMIYTGQTK